MLVSVLSGDDFKKHIYIERETYIYIYIYIYYIPCYYIIYTSQVI